MKPFFKSAGGKSWLVEKLVPEILATNPKTYLEPFLGGGAIMLALPPELPKVGGDMNRALVDAWLCVQRVPDALMFALNELYTREDALPNNALRKTELYLRVRDEFNATVNNPRSMWAPRAARFLWLNARCFNGLWRTNRKGFFNVPCANYPDPKRLSIDVIRTYTRALRSTTIIYGNALDGIRKVGAGLRVKRDLSITQTARGTVIYADPPYDGTFTGYTAEGFGDGDQAELAQHLRRAAENGARVFASNSDTPRIRELYAWANIEALDERHSVGAKADRRGARGCVLIRSRV